VKFGFVGVPIGVYLFLTLIGVNLAVKYSLIALIISIMALIYGIFIFV
jgi:hypothetical protein